MNLAVAHLASQCYGGHEAHADVMNGLNLFRGMDVKGKTSLTEINDQIISSTATFISLILATSVEY